MTLKLVPESLLGSLPVVQWVIQWVVHWIVSWVVSRIVSLVLFLSLLFLPEGIVHRHGFLLPPLHAFYRNWRQGNLKVVFELLTLGGSLDGKFAVLSSLSTPFCSLATGSLDLFFASFGIRCLDLFLASFGVRCLGLFLTSLGVRCLDLIFASLFICARIVPCFLLFCGPLMPSNGPVLFFIILNFEGESVDVLPVGAALV